jgi:hypothetical protein
MADFGLTVNFNSQIILDSRDLLLTYYKNCHAGKSKQYGFVDLPINPNCLYLEPSLGIIVSYVDGPSLKDLFQVPIE